VPSFSRDGKFVYFASDRTGDWQVWKVPVAGGPEIQVTNRGGFAALESPDGNIYYSKSDGSNPEIWRLPISGGAEAAVSPLVRPRTWSSWTVTKDGILLVADLADGRSHLSLYDPVRATVHELVSLQSAPRWMGATADGKKVVMNDAAERQISMLDNLR
jgi:Tol biopolymer transport system component